jgi:hypothetical protein
MKINRKSSLKRFSILLLCISLWLLLNSSSIIKKDDIQIEISWFTNLKGNFSFASKWSYASNVGLNDAQQIACLQNCSDRVQKMMNEDGLIISDSTDAYYQIVDSTRKYHTLESRSTLYDWKPSNFIRVRKYGNFTIEGSVIPDSNSKCSMFFRIKDNYLTAWAYHKPDKGSSKIYRLNGGKIFLDDAAFAKGIFKGTFSFTFENDINSLKPLFWSGKIQAKIEGF